MLCAKNSVDLINDLATNGRETIYLAILYRIVTVKWRQYTHQSFEFAKSNWVPPFRLHFKVNQSIILLRNIDPKNGLCSGTRLICKVLHPNVIDAAILTGERQGQRVFIPRIPMPTTDTGGDAVQFTRMQFPVRAAFAMLASTSQNRSSHTGNCMWRYRGALRSPGSRSWRGIRP